MNVLKHGIDRTIVNVMLCMVVPFHYVQIEIMNKCDTYTILVFNGMCDAITFTDKIAWKIVILVTYTMYILVEYSLRRCLIHISNV